MNQCVPSWDLDENLVVPPKIDPHAQSNSSNSSLPDVPSLEYEVAELTWENGQLAMHGLGPPRVVNKPTASPSPTKYATWDKPRAGGTLESIVDQATWQPQPQPQPKSAVDGGGYNANDLVPWFDYHRTMVNPSTSSSITMTMDALVPCNNNISRSDYKQENSTHVQDSMPRRMVGCSTRAGSGSAVGDGAGVARVGISSCRTNGSVSESATCGGGRHNQQVTLDTYERDLGGSAFTSTALFSQENTISAKEYTKTSADDRDSVCHSRSQRDQAGKEDGKKKGTGKSSVSTKRSRAAAIHNQSERKRRDKINERMKTLQRLVPNSSKTDKASMLNEVIEYLKQLQAQVHMMSRMNIPSMMLPLAMQQQLQMSMMAPAMGMGMGMGMGVMDMNAMSRAAGIPPVIPPAAAFMPVPSWDNPGECVAPTPPPPPPPGSVMPPDPLSAFFACHSQPMNMEAYSRQLAALYQQFQQPPAGPGPGAGSGTKN